MTTWFGQDFLGALLFGLLFLVLLALAETLRRRAVAGVESTRKLVHVGGGLLSLSLPWLVRSPVMVFGMSVGLAGVLWLARRHARLPSLHKVARRTDGTAYFPLAVFLVYIMTYDRYWLYVCAILVLAVADACAALIGASYGRLRYEIEEDAKSVEGSCMFLLIAFLALHLPMLLMTDLPRAVCVLSALLVAVLVTGFEAVSLGGADNLFIPLGVVVVLAKITTKPLPEILYQNLSLFTLAVLLGWVSRRSRAFNTGGAVMMILFIYGVWSLGSEIWALPVLSGFLLYAAVRMLLFRGSARRLSGMPRIRPRMLFRALVIPLLLLVIGNMWNQAEFFFAPFVLSVTVLPGMAIYSHLRQRVSADTGFRRLFCFVGIAGLVWAGVLLPAWLLQPSAFGVLLPVAGALLIPILFWLDDGRWRRHGSSEDPWPAGRLVLTVVAASIMMLVQHWMG